MLEKCGYADKYKGIRKPTCGCRTCEDIYRAVHIKSFTDTQLKAMWDDESLDPNSVLTEAVHKELNVRGLGVHCAV